MEPRIQYATTADGVSIAYWSIGEGLPLVVPPPATPWSHIEMEWQIPEWRHWYEHLAESVRVIRYDERGTGLSDRNIAHLLSVDGKTRDLEAIVSRLGLDRIALFGCYYAALPAISYTAKHPDRVSHLVLWCGLANTSESQKQNRLHDTMTDLLERDYPFFTETLTHSIFGWEEGESAHRLALYMQAALTAEEARACWAVNQDIDLTPLLRSISTPTLVMHRREFAGLDLDTARRLAGTIPDARLLVLDGKSLSPFVGDAEETSATILEFLGAKPRPGTGPTHAHPEHRAETTGFRTIMFTDMQDSTVFTQRLGDAQAQRLVRLHNTIVSDALERFGGTQVKHTGDGIMAWFPTASGAVESAIEIQRAFETHNEATPDDTVNVRIGINAGEPVVEGDDLFGIAVQLASRICARAEPGEIFTSDVVRQLVAGKGFLFADHGEVELRGFEDLVRLYEVRWRKDSP